MGAMETSISMRKFGTSGLIFRFDHLDDARLGSEVASKIISESFPEWQLRYAKAADFHGPNSLRQFEAQVNVKLTSSTDVDFCTQDTDNLRMVVQSAVHEIGDIVAWKVQNDDRNMFLMRIEMASCDAADTLIRKRGLRSPLPGHPVSAQSLSSFVVLSAISNLCLGVGNGSHQSLWNSTSAQLYQQLSDGTP